MEKAFLFLILLIVISTIHSVDIPLNSSAVQNAASGLIFLAAVPSGTHLNPAYLSQGIETGACYLFNIKDLPYYAVHFGLSTEYWGLYLAGSHLAHPSYQETLSNISLNYQKDFISVGLALRIVNNRISNYQNSHGFVCDAGIIIFHDKLVSGFTLRNLTRTRFQGNILPVVLLWEMNYSFSGNSSVSIGIEKERNYDFTLKMGAYYRLHPYIALISSYQYAPDRIGAGFKLLPLPLRISYSVLYHRYLSPTHFFSIAYEF